MLLRGVMLIKDAWKLYHHNCHYTFYSLHTNPTGRIANTRDQQIFRAAAFIVYNPTEH